MTVSRPRRRFLRADELLTSSQAGDYLRTGERFVRRLIAERRISFVKLGKYVRLQWSDLDAFIESDSPARDGVAVSQRAARALGRR